LDGDAEADLDAGGEILGDDLLRGGVELVAVCAVERGLLVVIAVDDRPRNSHCERIDA